MILQIVDDSNPKLRIPSIDVTIGDDLSELIRDMFDTNQRFNGVGLAAPQIGENKNIFIIDFKGLKKVFINPKITPVNNKTTKMQEGCLSISKCKLDIQRYELIKVEYYNRKYEFLEEFYYGMVSRIIQYETDHLNGILISDRKNEQ